MTAFCDIKRCDQQPADYLVGAFAYLNNSARPEAARVRYLVDEWISNLPEHHREKMVTRFRSGDDGLHRSAHFEIFLYALLVQQGFSVVAIEPQVSNGRAPDFLVDALDGTRFYLEATLASGVSKSGAGADRLMREALQAIDKVASPHFFLNLSTRGKPTRPIAINKLRYAVQRYVDSLDYEAAIKGAATGKPYNPIWQHNESGAYFRISAFPKHTLRSGDRAIGGRTIWPSPIHPVAAIRSAVQEKARRYGQLGLPLVIAVNAIGDYARLDHAMDALFGTPTTIATEEEIIGLRRKPNGAWYGLGGPVYTRVSAVLFVDRLSPWSIEQRTAHIIYNPWATYPFLQMNKWSEICSFVGNDIFIKRSKSLGEIFSLQKGWPE